MDGKAPRGQKRHAKERGQKHADTAKAAQRKPQRHTEKAAMPLLVAGREVLGRELSVFKNSNKSPVWIKGEVRDFDEPTVRHKIRYELPLPEVQMDEEEWLCLGKSMFMWKDEDFICPLANPTYSAKYTPKKQEAIGQRVKVFWTAMGKWYQGKVMDYDASSGKHRVSFRDGDEKRCLLRQEALVWLDVPQLASETAIKKMRSEEGEPAAASEGDENQAPVEDGPQSVEKGKPASNGKRRTRGGAAKDPPTEAQPPPNQEQRKNGKTPVKSSPKQAAEAKARPVRSNASCGEANGAAAEDSKSASSTSLQPAADTSKAAVTNVAAANLPGPSTPAALQQPVPPPASNGSTHACSSDASRKRSRLGLPVSAAAITPAAGEPEAKRRLTVKPGRGPAKPGRKPKRVVEESRLGARRQKSEADVEFEEACQAVMGARLGVWWEDDRCYYKGKVVAHDWYHKRLKVLYDDGFEEFISPQKPETQFTWLTPRAKTAGATDAVHAAFRLLAASNAGGLDPVSAPVAAPTNGAVVGSTADGSRLEALVPLRQAVGMLGVKVEESRPASCGPHPVDSTTRAVSSQAKPSSGTQRLPASGNGTILTGLQAMLPQTSLLQLAGGKAGEHKFAITPEPGMKPAVTQPQLAPQGQAAEGWKVSLVFRGNNQIYQGRVLQHDPQLGRHHILWDDGEDEWVDATKEALTWHADRLKSTGFTAGLPAGQPAPRGEGLVGWRIAVYWKEEKQFYQGTVEDYDAELDQHTISYNDGDELCESLDGQVFKYVLPPTVQPVAAARPGIRLRSDSPGRDPLPERRARRRQRSVDYDDDDSDEDWGWALERRPAARAAVMPTALQREAAPGVATPRTCDIRRLNSRHGSLLVYEGEETNVDATPGNSPKFSPRATLGLCVEALPDPRGPPVLDRRVSGLRTAQGFRVGVKRVRVYLPGAELRKASPDPSSCGQAGDSKQQQIPSQETLQRMLARVDAARQAVHSGIPAGEGDGSKPCQALDAQAQATAEEAEQPSSPPGAPQEEQLTPPPSPFAGYPASETAPMCSEPANDCCPDAMPVAANGSMSLPQTPSAASEGQLLTPSRNGSVVSAPILAELVQLKAAVPASAPPKSGTPQKVAG